MTKGFMVYRCAVCKTALFPQRLLCPQCHGAEFSTETAEDGIVEDVTVIRHMIGQTDWKPRRIANVLVRGGLRITVGLQDGSEEGATIDLYDEGGAPLGVRKGSPLSR